MNTRQDIEFTRGDTVTQLITVTDYLGAVVDITGAKFMFTMKQSDADSAYDDEAVISVTWVSHTTPESGITTLLIPAEDTKVTSRDYMYDVQMVLDGIVTTLKYGNAKVKREVTNRIT